MSILSCLVSQPNNKSNLNSEQSINSSDLSPITFGVILPPKLRVKISTNSQINPTTSDENKYSKVLASIVRKDALYERHKILKQNQKKVNYGRNL